MGMDRIVDNRRPGKPQGGPPAKPKGKSRAQRGRKPKDYGKPPTAEEYKRLNRKERQFHLPDRLPDESEFVARYDARKFEWTGCLTVNGQRFFAVHTAVFKLLRNLDFQYHDWLEAQAAGTVLPGTVGNVVDPGEGKK